MKEIKQYILERSQDYDKTMFYTKDRGYVNGKDDEVKFKQGEKVILIKYNDKDYIAGIHGIYTVDKVNKKSVVIDFSKKNDDGLQYPGKDKNDKKYDTFNMYGIRTSIGKLGGPGWKSKINYIWVLYNKDMLNEMSIQDLLKSGSNGQGYHFRTNEKEQKIKQLKELVNQL